MVDWRHGRPRSRVNPPVPRIREITRNDNSSHCVSIDNNFLLLQSQSAYVPNWLCLSRLIVFCQQLVIITKSLYQMWEMALPSPPGALVIGPKGLLSEEISSLSIHQCVHKYGLSTSTTTIRHHITIIVRDCPCPSRPSSACPRGRHPHR